MKVRRLAYDEPRFHVERRSGLSGEITRPLTPFSAGFDADALSGEAHFWTRIHEGLLDASATLPQWYEAYGALQDSESIAAAAPRLISLGSQLIHHAHGHHNIEDHHFFTAFIAHFPELADPIELLECDHEVLGEVLEDMEAAVRGLHAVVSEDTGPQRDRLLSAGETLQAASMRLDRLFRRHIADEEEICLPVLTRLQG